MMTQPGGSSVVAWGDITGTLSNQTDLQAALDEKVEGPASSVDHEIARFDGTTGKQIEGGGITIADGQSGSLSGTNSGDVTLAGSPDYITIAAQVITRALINLTTHVTSRLPFANFVAATAASRLLGRGSAAGSGNFEEITLGTNLSLSGTVLNAAGSSAVAAPKEPGGRLTVVTGVPVPTVDVTGAGTLFYTPYVGSTVWTYDSSVWTEHALAQISLALTVTTANNYDVFVFNNAGTLTLVLSDAWTDATTRANALALQDGVNVLGSDHSRLWLGTIRASGANVTEMSVLKQFVSNAYNTVMLPLNVIDTTDTWTYQTFTYRQARASTTNQVDMVCCRAGMEVTIKGTASSQGSADGFNSGIAIGEDSTTTPVAGSIYIFGAGIANVPAPKDAAMSKRTLLGYHFYVWLEIATASGTQTWFGDSGNAGIQSGLVGMVEG